MRSVLELFDWPNELGVIFGQDASPRVTEENVVAEFEVPGFEAGDLTLELDSDPRGRSVLVLSGTKETASGVRSVNRAVLIPTEVSEETAVANLANGVLTVTLERVKKERHIITINS